MVKCSIREFSPKKSRQRVKIAPHSEKSQLAGDPEPDDVVLREIRGRATTLYERIDRFLRSDLAGPRLLRSRQQSTVAVEACRSQQLRSSVHPTAGVDGWTSPGRFRCLKLGPSPIQSKRKRGFRP